MQISVIMPVWNMADSLERSIATILNQTYRDFELIVVDDGSTDETPRVLASLAAADSRIRVIHQENSGIVTALNRAISESTGKYIARADGDDLYEPERLQVQFNYLEAHANVVLLCCSYHLSYPDGTSRLVVLPETHTDILRRQLLRNEIMHSSVMMRSSALIQAGGYLERWRHLEDYELWFRLARFGKIASIPQPLARYRLHPGGISQKMETYQVRRGLLLRLQILWKRQVPFLWIRYLPKHIAKAAVPNKLLVFSRRLAARSKGISA
jgi:glycosyltransferase involved in cell wall biosynthesis